jgi:heptosyltransferase-2
MTTSPRIPAERIVILMPTWLGDAVMATPFLRALAGVYPQAHIAAVARPLAAPVLAGLPYVHEVQVGDKRNGAATARWLRAGRFDLGISLPNAFRAAWMLFRARVPVRLGYARDWRTPLLTHTLRPLKRSPEQHTADDRKRDAIRRISRALGHEENPAVGSAYEPTPAIDYYLALAEYLGAESPSKRMELAVTPEENAAADGVLASIPAIGNGEPGPLLTFVPGANFGSSKCYPPEHFAAVAASLIATRNATIILAGSPAEAPIIRAIVEHTPQPLRESLFSLPTLNDGRGAPLGVLKELIRRSALVIANDTGPRHFAAAFNVPTVTLFGPTDPRWAETYHQRERIARIDVPCGPCQLKKCPIDHRCLRGLTPGLVLAAAEELLR